MSERFESKVGGDYGAFLSLPVEVSGKDAPIKYWQMPTDKLAEKAGGNDAIN